MKTNEYPVKTHKYSVKRDPNPCFSQNEFPDMYGLLGLRGENFNGSHPIAAAMQETWALPEFLLFCGSGRKRILRSRLNRLAVAAAEQQQGNGSKEIAEPANCPEKDHHVKQALDAGKKREREKRETISLSRLITAAKIRSSLLEDLRQTKMKARVKITTACRVISQKIAFM